MIDCSKRENYFAEKQRMTKRQKGGICELHCCDCPLCSKNNGTSEILSCTSFEMRYPEKAIESVQKWSNEHPQKTYLSEFLKNYPNAPLNRDGVPKMCLYVLGFMSMDDCRDGCIECWNQPIKE